jgi:hypothetical protein
MTVFSAERGIVPKSVCSIDILALGLVIHDGTSTGPFLLFNLCLPNSPIPIIEHLRGSKSADEIGAQLAKLPHKKPNKANFLVSISEIVRLCEL